VAKIDQKISDTGFTVVTRLDHNAILNAAEAAAGKASTTLDKVQQATAPGSGFAFEVKRVGLAKIASFVVDITEDPAGRRVTMRPLTYVTSQPRVMFIPVGPKSSSALRPLQRFSDAFQRSLAG
jgi:hypothetical protein